MSLSNFKVSTRLAAGFGIVILLLVGVVFYRIDLPSGGDWLTFAWVTVLGAAACTLLGIAISSIAKNGRSASAVVTPFALLLQFISGVFFQFSEIPHWMQVFASLFPLKWMAQGLRSVFLPDELAADEPAGGWELDRVALVLGIWCIAGLVLCIKSFRWQDRLPGRWTPRRSGGRRRFCCTTTSTAGCGRRR